MIINFIAITICIVFIIDLSGIIPTLNKTLQKLLKTEKQLTIKPFSCSLCMTHHVLLIYMLFVNPSIINYLIICLLSFATPIIKDILILIKDILIKIIDTIYFLINKI